MKETDMTTGKPAKLIFRFALPLMAGNIFQQLYTIVDAAFVGRFAGIQALAAVGSADWFNWLVLGMVWGYTQGFSVLISQRFGAGDMEGLKKAVGQSISLTAIISVFLLIVSQLLVSPALTLLQVPGEIRPQASLYLRVLFAGLPIAAAYNVQAGILRAVGDARTPLVAMVIASLTNIALDALFVIAFRWGVEGASAATVIAQGVSAVYCLRVIMKMPAIRFGKGDLQPDRHTAPRLIALGTPAALQNGIIGTGGMVISRVVNGFGEIFIAGYTATNKLYGLMEMAATSFGTAIATFSGQNFGAGKMQRIKNGVYTGAKISVVTAVAIAAVLFLVGRSVLSLFVDGSAAQVEEVLDVAQMYLNVMLFALVSLYLLYVYRSALQGMGDTVTPMISGFVELVMRVGCALTLPVIMGQMGIYIAEVAAWIGAAILLCATYLYKIRKLTRTEVY